MSEGGTPYRFESGKDYQIVVLQPELNGVQWDGIERIGTECLERLQSVPKPAVVVDLSALDYMGSAMVALIVRLWKPARERGGRMAVVVQNRDVREVITLAGLDKHWAIVETQDAALGALDVKREKSRKRSTSSDGVDTVKPAGSTGAVFALVGGIFAIGGATLGLYNPQETFAAKTALGVTFGSSAVGLILGTLATAAGRGVTRILGVLIVLVCLGAIVCGVLRLPGFRDQARTNFPTAVGPHISPRRTGFQPVQLNNLRS